MPTLPRNIFPGYIYHVFNRSTEKRRIFYTEKDYNKFLDRMIYYKEITKIKILCYSILPNHFHFLLKEPTSRVAHPEGLSAISNFVSLLTNSYTKYFNYSKNHPGRIFQGPFKSKLVNTDPYLQSVFAYINLNALKHKIVQNINDWPYTSHHELIENIHQADLFSLSEYKEIIVNNVNKIKNIDMEFD